MCDQNLEVELIVLVKRLGGVQERWQRCKKEHCLTKGPWASLACSLERSQIGLSGTSCFRAGLR